MTGINLFQRMRPNSAISNFALTVIRHALTLLINEQALIGELSDRSWAETGVTGLQTSVGSSPQHLNSALKSLTLCL